MTLYNNSCVQSVARFLCDNTASCQCHNFLQKCQCHNFLRYTSLEDILLKRSWSCRFWLR